MMAHDRSRANLEVVLDQLISRLCQDPGPAPGPARSGGCAKPSRKASSSGDYELSQGARLGPPTGGHPVGKPRPWSMVGVASLRTVDWALPASEPRGGGVTWFDSRMWRNHSGRC
jgi:hypothetical protein